MKYLKKVFFMFLIVSLASCGFMNRPVTEIEVQSFDVVKKDLKIDNAINVASGILVDRGFDMKLINKDAGILTTEYKKFASVNQKPPFDYYLQIRFRIKVDAKGNTVIQMSPTVKEQNRLNVGAFTEHELIYYAGDPQNIKLIKSMREDIGWRALGQILFMNVVNDVAASFGLTIEEVIQNVTKTAVNALSVT
jgi:hypothetical protein